MEQPVKLDGVVIDLIDLRDFMNDELVEKVRQLSFNSDQKFIELYLYHAWNEDRGFIDFIEAAYSINVTEHIMD